MTGRRATPTTKPQAAGASRADAPTQSGVRPSKNRGVIEYRRLTAEDCEPVAAFAIEGMPSHDGLLLSPQKVRAVVWHFWKSATDFHLVAWEGRKVVGVLAAVVMGPANTSNGATNADLLSQSDSRSSCP